MIGKLIGGVLGTCENACVYESIGKPTLCLITGASTMPQCQCEYSSCRFDSFPRIFTAWAKHDLPADDANIPSDPLCPRSSVLSSCTRPVATSKWYSRGQKEAEKRRGESGEDSAAGQSVGQRYLR